MAKTRTIGIKVDVENNGERFWGNARENIGGAPTFARTWLRLTDVVEELTCLPASAIALLEWCETVEGWDDPSGEMAPFPIMFVGFTSEDERRSPTVARYLAVIPGLRLASSSDSS